MKYIKRIGIWTLLMCLFLVNTTWANELDWNNVLGNHSQSILLESNIMSSKDSIHRYGRGEYLAEGSVEIINYGEGIIYVRVDTLAYVNVDRILHTVFLDYWDEDLNDWVQESHWNFEKTREEAGGELYRLTTAFTLDGYETGLYYRLRGLHGVEYNDELEACATRTNGVLITD